MIVNIIACILYALCKVNIVALFQFTGLITNRALKWSRMGNSQ